MERKHFLEQLERDNDYQHEYTKIEELFCNAVRCTSAGYYQSLNTSISEAFLKWENRKNYTSFEEVRNKLGFPIKEEYDEKTRFLAKSVDLNGYLTYCEMIMTLINALNRYLDHRAFKDIIDAIIHTIKSTIEKAGLEMVNCGKEIKIISINPVATHVVDLVPELADTIIEYNQYLLRGNIDRKRSLLKQIADALEPKRDELNKLIKRNTDDFFYLVNTMNIRHNNIDPADTKKYNAIFASMSQHEKENWYDLIYEQALSLYVALEQQNRNRKIEAYKQQTCQI